MAELLAFPGLSRTTERFRSELVAQARASSLDPNNVAAVISLESGFDPTATNGKHAGLIMFYYKYFPPIAQAAQHPEVQWEDLPKLSAAEQLPFVMAWFRVHGITYKNDPGDYLLTVFMPGQLGKPKELVIAKQGSTDYVPGTLMFQGTVYDQNKPYDFDHDGEITIGDLDRGMNELLERARGRAPVPVEELPPSEASVGGLLGLFLIFGGLGLAMSTHRR
jgi:hypothetical protein